MEHMTITECRKFLIDEIDLAENDGVPETKRKLKDVLLMLDRLLIPHTKTFHGGNKKKSMEEYKQGEAVEFEQIKEWQGR